MVDRKFCPSCNKQPIVTVDGIYNEKMPFTKFRYAIKCQNIECPEKPTTALYSSEEYAISTWNTRIAK